MEIKTYKIKDICDIKRGRVISKLDIKKDPGVFPVYSAATNNDGEFGRINSYDFDGEYVTWTADGYGGAVFYRNGKFSITNLCGLLKVKNKEISSKYLAHILKLEAPKFTNRVFKNRPKLTHKTMAEIPIDFPPLKIQEKIATILDTFTELSAELRERKKQYAFYRDYLLNQENIRKIYGANIPFETFQIRDICEINRGREINEKYLRENPGEFPVYSSATTNGGLIGKINDYDFHGEYVTWTTGGAHAGNVFYRNEKFSCSQNCGLLEVKNKNKFSSKFLCFALKLQSKKFVNYASAIPVLTIKRIAEIELSFPPLEIQEKIADILFAFEKLCNDLTEGIPAEIELRKKQLDYYQNFLFNWVQNKKLESLKSL
ncbi:restriction endonuclease subunit S [Mycoplasmoides pneumoniae]|uniref:restriction endonuclease subunit S n=1 Tax=Mycoplasmoides pneumoniae TaxID=2104 RepID=UPI0009FCF452|nr:restriction endonuclease subunit S [Mycoplasmoides pneumoniae]ARI13747.1 restriction endonuclease subunit S [Mycoplasmoides pneumoniae]